MNQYLQHTIVAMLGYAALDFLVFVVASLQDLPCSLTEWICYPFYWPGKWLGLHGGVSMRSGIIWRLVEIVCIAALAAMLAGKNAA